METRTRMADGRAAVTVTVGGAREPRRLLLPGPGGYRDRYDHVRRACPRHWHKESQLVLRLGFKLTCQ